MMLTYLEAGELKHAGSDEVEIMEHQQTPQHLRLWRILLGLGGKRVCHGVIEEHLFQLLTAGKRWPASKARVHRGERSRCHQNTTLLYKANPGSKIVTGYGLTKRDGIWRCHSWLWFQGGIIETTIKRQMYFGAELTEEESEEFVYHNT